MIARSLAILIASALPSSALTVPMTSPLAENALVAGSMVTLLAALGLGNNVARRAAVAVTLWIGLSVFLFDARMLDFAVIVPWTVATLVSLAGPFSAPPQSVILPAVTPAQTVARYMERAEQRAA